MARPFLIMKGYITLHRSIMRHWLYGNYRQTYQWIDLLLFASYEDNDVIFDGTPIKLKRGELVGSTRYLASRWRVCKQTAQNFIKLLEAENMISRRRAGRFTIFKIVNYDKYQPSATSSQSANVLGQVLGQSKESMKKIKNTITPSRESDEVFFKNFYESDSFFADMACQFNFTEEQLRIFAHEFRSLMLGKRQFHTSQSDYNQHFFNWINYEKIQKSATKTSVNHASQDRYQSRRGTDAGNHTEDDYSETFTN